MIAARELTVRYAGANVDALRRISLCIADGEFVAVMGANGSGKSTLARSLNGLVSITSGSILVDGINTANLEGRTQIRRRLGMVFQNPHVQVTSLTVEREIAFGLQNIGIEAGELHRRVEEELLASRLVHARMRPPARLAAGELQRLALASVLVMHPAHLILDEATSLLSPPSRREVLQRVQEERARRTMSLMMITQFFREAMDAPRLLLLQNGALAFDGPPAKANEDPVLRPLLGRQQTILSAARQ
jgi:energy-coupling factor transporter ATP-binding protein EcfA2